MKRHGIVWIVFWSFLLLLSGCESELGTASGGSGAAASGGSSGSSGESDAGTDGATAGSAGEGGSSASPGAGGFGLGGSAPVEGPELEQGAHVYFIDSDDGDDTNDGLYATPQADGKGPWKTLKRADGFDFSADDELYLRAGSQFVGELLWNTSMQGKASHRFVLGAYYLDGDTPRRGVYTHAKPIIYGTLDFANHNGNSVLDDSKPRPAQSALYPKDMWSGLVQFVEQDHVRVENLDVRHSGGRGINFSKCEDVQIIGCDLDGMYQSPIMVDQCDGVLIEDVWAKGDSMSWKFYDASNWPSSVSVKWSSNVTLRRVHTWDGFGEGINVWHGSKHVVVENSSVLDNRAVGFYIDSQQDFVYRSNIALRTGRTRYHRNSQGRGANIAFNNESFQFTSGGGKLTSADTCKNGVLVNTITAGGAGGLVNWGQHESSDFANVYIYGLLGLGNGIQVGNMISPMSGSRIWDSVFLGYGGSDVGDAPEGVSIERNYFASGAPSGWANASVSGVVDANVTDGWQNIEDWVPRSLPDDSFTKAEYQLLLQKVIDNARLVAGGAWEAAGHDAGERTWPSGVTPIDGALETDIEGKPFSNPVDIGPFAR